LIHLLRLILSSASVHSSHVMVSTAAIVAIEAACTHLFTPCVRPQFRPSTVSAGLVAAAFDLAVLAASFEGGDLGNVRC
jgi:hypothetical protein